MRCAVYLRVSSEEQRDRQTIEGQRQYAEACLKRDGLTATFHADDGVSGTIPVEKRPAGARLLAEIAAGRYDLLLVYRVDRLARSLLELLRCVETLDHYGVGLRSLSEPFDTSTALGRAFLQLLGIFAELERNSIHERTSLGKARRAAEGLWMGGPAPFGYRLILGRLAEEAWEAEIVREMFRLCQEGYSTQQVATLLNARGVPNPTHSRKTAYRNAGVWIYTTVGSILRNPVYRGEARFRTSVCPSPPLVSAEDWQATQQALRSRRSQPKVTGRAYLLTGLLTCDLCDGAAGGTSVLSRGRRFHYYRCSKERRTGRTCAAPHVPAEKLETDLWGMARQALLSPDAYLGELRTILLRQQERQPVPSELEGIEAAEREKGQERARLIGLVRRGLITDDEAEVELLQLRQETDALQARASEVRAALVTDTEIEERVNRLQALLGRLREYADTDRPEERRIVLSELLRGTRIGRENRQAFVEPAWVWEPARFGE